MKKDFLKYVAEDILKKHGSDLSDVTVVFPNKRAALFLNEYLAQDAGHPIWAPEYMTISELFKKHSTLIVGDQIKLICEIYKSFTECTGIDETLDHFYGWGELLLADFDDIDKHIADASKVFANVKDIKEFDDLSFLTDEQREILSVFFKNMEKCKDSELKSRFLKLWSHLDDIYVNFRARLRRQDIAYEGMLYRDVAEDKDIDYGQGTYIFVGFNVIQNVEQEVFTRLKKNGQAKFYWDFDKYYIGNAGGPGIGKEAGHYISQYLKYFPNELDSSNAGIYDNLDKDKDISFISATTENIQARYINDWLSENDRYKHGKRTAIVMCDESLLPTIIHCLPEGVDKVNITTGFPLFQTPIAALVLLMMEMQTSGHSIAKDRYRLYSISKVLGHPYACYISDRCTEILAGLKRNKIFYPTASQITPDESTKLLFERKTSNKDLTKWVLDILEIIARNAAGHEKDQLFRESLFRTYTLFNRIDGLLEAGDLDVDKITFQKLLYQLINSTSIPFHGEPAEGIQIMGILETRNLDFDHVLILSCNEGNMPKGISDSSFIPYSIRKAYGLTTVDNKVSIYAYYFHNLIQRAEDVTITYNNSTEDGHTGEMSRFMLQLMVESNLKIKRLTMKAGLKQAFMPPKEITKSDAAITALKEMPYISPTAINRYMRCQLQFYYNNIAKITEPDEEDGTLDSRMFGNIFHDASELIYERFLGIRRTIKESDIEDLIKHRGQIETAVDEAFRKNAFGSGGIREYNGLQLINREVIIKYIRRLLEIDKTQTPFEIKGLEFDVYKDFEIKTKNGAATTRIGGRIDRLDLVYDRENNTRRLRVIDYKTGGYARKSVRSVAELFDNTAEHSKIAEYFRQTMLYSIIINSDDMYGMQGIPVSPALLFIQHTHEDDYDPVISIDKEKISDITRYEDEFTARLKGVLDEMFDREVPFRPAEDKSVCAYCPYRNTVCGI